MLLMKKKNPIFFIKILEKSDKKHYFIENTEILSGFLRHYNIPPPAENRCKYL